MHVRLARVVGNPWVRLAAAVVPIGLSAWSLERSPRVSLAPLLPALAACVVGKYLLCPLRWRAVTGPAQTRWWHLRAYAEGELLGLLSPAHVGADLWRAGRLYRAGSSRAAATASVALDRLVGAVALILGGVLVGVGLPPDVALPLLAIGAVAVVAVVAERHVRSRRDPGARPRLPRVRTIAYGLVLSVGYQLGVVTLLLAAVTGLDHAVAPQRLLAVYIASQVAGIVPGVNGLSARDAALAVGIASLGVSWSAAAGAAALMAMLAWPPALVFGGGSMVAAWFMGRRPPTRRWAPARSTAR